jgi:hypothetical protein
MALAGSTITSFRIGLDDEFIGSGQSPIARPRSSRNVFMTDPAGIAYRYEEMVACYRRDERRRRIACRSDPG